MIKWITVFPRKPKTRYLTFLLDVETGDTMGFGTSTGMSLTYKIWVIAILGVPKIIVCGALWLYGASYVMLAASEEDAILNAVAVLFILSIDDLLFEAAVSGEVKKTVANMPKVPWHSAGEARALDYYCFICSQCNSIVFICLMTLAVWIINCT